jgi:1,4-dihydroxy-2-naphthoyl-CoA hydrolase
VTGPTAEPNHAEARDFMQATMGELNQKLGVEFLEVTKERVVATMPVEGNRQPYGLLHGGASIALAETLGSVMAALHAGPERQTVGVDMNATHHRSARDGVVTGTCTVVNAGRTLVSSEIVVTDADGRRLCTARLTCLLLDPR